MNIDFTNISIFKNIHHNKPVIICGSGPSLNDIDLTKISKNYIIFACNQAVTAMNYCDYFCMTDAAVPETTNLFEHGSKIANKVISLGGLWQITTLPYYNDIKNKTFFIQREQNSNNNSNFNKDLIIFGTDVIHATAHFAYLLGCNPIMFIGVDLLYKNGRKYCKGTTYNKEILWWGTQSFDFSNNTTKPITDSTLNESFEEWKKIKTINPNIEFVNLSKNSRLTEIFRTINLEDLYNDNIL